MSSNVWCQAFRENGHHSVEIRSVHGVFSEYRSKCVTERHSSQHGYLSLYRVTVSQSGRTNEETIKQPCFSRIKRVTVRSGEATRATKQAGGNGRGLSVCARCFAFLSLSAGLLPHPHALQARSYSATSTFFSLPSPGVPLVMKKCYTDRSHSL